MNFEDAISIMYENQTHQMIDEMYREDPELDADAYEPDFDEVDLYELQA